MASAFNLTAQINLRGPSNVRNIVSDIRRQLGTITGDVNLRINPATTRNVTALNTALTTLNNNLRTTSANATDAANAIRQFGSAISSIGNSAAGLNRNLGNTATAANNAAAGIRNTATNTQAASAEMVEFGRTAGLAVRRFAAFSMSAGAIMGLTNAIRQGIDAFIEYDKQFVKLQQVTGESASGLSQLANTITQLSTSLGVSSKDLTEVSLTLTQAGLTARDTERALKALALSSLAPSFDNMNQTVEGSIALMRQFGISAIDLEKSLGAVNAVSAKFAVEASDIIAAIQRTGGVFASASKGVSEGTDALNEFIAVFTSVRATTRESAETIATGLRTIFTRIQRGGTIEALKEFGVNLTDAEGKFVGAYKAVQLLSEGLNQIDPRDLKFSQIVEELGGFRQIGKVIPLIQQFATAQDALRVAQQGQGSLAADAAKAQASLANQAAKVREEFLALFREIGGSDTFQALAKGALSLASALISVADSVKGVLPVLAIMTAFKGASGIRQFGTGFLRGLRPAQGAKFGGKIGKYKLGGDVDVPVALTPGEAVIFPEYAAKIGTPTLRRMNYADKRQKRAKGGKIGVVPGQGNSDSFYTTLPEGSFVIRKAATESLGVSNISDIAKGRKKFAPGGLVPIANRKPSLKLRYDINQDSISGFFIDRRQLRKQRTTYRNEAQMIVDKASQLYMTGDIKKKIKPMSDKARELADSYIYRKTSGLSARLTKKDLRTTTEQNPRRLNKVQGALAELTVENKLKKAGKKPRKLPYPGGADYAIGRTSFIEVKNKQQPTDDLELKAKALLGYAYTTSKSPIYYKNQKKDIIPKLNITLQSNNPQDFGYGGIVQKFGEGSDNPITFPGRQKFLKVIKTPEASSLIGDRDAYKILGKKPESRSGQDAADFETLMAAYREAVKNSTSPDPVTATAQTAAATKEETRKSKEPGARKKSITVGAIGLTGQRGKQKVRSKQGTKITVQKGVVDPGLSRRFRADVRKVSRELAKKWGGIFAAQSGSSPVVDKKELNRILGPGLSNITGAVFESALAAAGAPYEATLRKRPIDFPQGLGRVGAIAGLPGDLATEAKTDLSAAALTRVATQADPSPRKKQPKKRAKLKYGGFPLVDDLPNAPGSLTPMPGIGPGSPLYKIIKNKGGVLDYDRTLQRTVGDAAYASAKTEEQRNAVLNRYFRDSSARLQDAKTAKLTQFGQQLQALIKKGIIDPKKLSIISKSSKTEGLPEHINRLFGIPTTNMEFTSGQSKVGLLQEIRKKGPKSYRRYANGGSLYKNDKNKQAGYDPKKLAEFLGASPAVTDKQKKLAEMLNDGKIEKPNYEELLKKARGYAAGGEIPIMAQEGEYVINRKSAKAIGYGNLNKLNKYHSGGVVQKFARGGRLRDINDNIVRGGVNYGDDAASQWALRQKEADIRKRWEERESRRQTRQTRIEARTRARESIGQMPSAPQASYKISRQQLSDFTVRAAGSRSIQAEKDKALASGKVLNDRVAARRVLINREQERIKQENIKTGTVMTEDETRALAKKQVSQKTRARAKEDAVARIEGDRTAASARLFGDRGARGAVNMAEGTDRGKDAKNRRNIALQTLRAEEKQLKAFTSLSSADQLDRINKARVAAGKKTLNAAELQQRLEAKTTKLNRDIASAKNNYRNTIVDIAKQQIESGTREQGGTLTTRQDRVQEAANKRRPERTGFRGLLRTAGLTAQRAMFHQSLDAGTAPPTEFQRRTRDVLARAGTAGMAERANTRLTDLTRSDAFRALDPAAKKQALANAGFGRDGAGSQAIMRGRNRGGGGGGSGGGGSGGGGAGTGGSVPSGDRQSMSSRMMGMSFAIPMIADMFTSGEAKSASQAYSQTAVQGVATSVGSGMMMGSMVTEMIGGPMGKMAGIFTGVATAAYGIIKSFADAENAARQFEITARAVNLETSLETANKALNKWSQDLQDKKGLGLAEQARKDVLRTANEASNLRGAKETTQRGVTNFFDTGAGSAERSDILFEKGIGAYLSTTALPVIGNTEKARENQSELYRSMIPKKAVEASKDYGGAADAFTTYLEQKLRSGSSFSDIRGAGATPTGASPDFMNMAKSLALADSAVQEEIMSIKNSRDIREEDKSSMIEGIVARSAESKAMEIEARVRKSMDLEEFSRSTNQLQNSLERMFQNMEQAINKNVFELNNLSQQAELSAAALSGNAKAGQTSLKSINVLQNPRAYTDKENRSAIRQASGMFGGESQTMQGLLKASGKLENTIMSTINNTIKEDPNAGNEKIGSRINVNISKALKGLNLPPDISDKLGREVNNAIGEIRQKGDEKINFGDLVEKIPQLGKVIDSARRAQEIAIKSLEHWQNNLNDYANTMNQLVDAQVEANSRIRRASDIQARGQMELDKVLGKEISLRDQMNVALAGVRSQTGGETNPALIAGNIVKLDQQRAVQQTMSNTAAQRGPSGADEFRLMQDRLRNTNIALRENYDALKNMADNTEMASIAMSKINEIQQKRQAGVNMAERLVTSSPQELSQLNRAMDRLNNNMQGGINFGSSAEQRKESLDAFNMIAPFLGEKQNGMKANVLESMLMESGVGVNPMMAEVLQSLRNPEADPEMQAAIAEYKRAVDVQSLANAELAKLSQLMQQNTADIAATKLATAMTTVQLDFKSQQLNDINEGIKTLIAVTKEKPGAATPATRALGGIIYASAGQQIDFSPKGTDTVPAMLTPGEFVVNRKATQKHLPLLKSINSSKYQSGGKVKYYERGGFVTKNDWRKKDAEGNVVDDKLGDYGASSSRVTPLETKESFPDIKPGAIDTSSSKIDTFTAPYQFYATANSPQEVLNSSSLSPTNIVPQFGTSYKSLRYENHPSTTATSAGAGIAAGVLAGAATIAILTGVGAPAGVLLGLAAAGVAAGTGVAAARKADQKGTSITGEFLPEIDVTSLDPVPDVIKYNAKGINVDTLKKNTKKLKEAELKPYADYIKQLITAFSLTNRVKNAAQSDKPDSLPTLNPSIQDYSSGGSAIFSFENLGVSDPNRTYGLFSNRPIQKPGKGNIFGFRATSVGAFELAAGENNIKNLIPTQYLSGTKAYDTSTATATQLKGEINTISQMQSLLMEVQNKLPKDLTKVRGDLQETEQSVQNKNNIRNISQLFDNISPYVTLGTDVLNTYPGTSPPYTVYGDAITNKWNSYLPDLKQASSENPFRFAESDKSYIGIDETDKAGNLTGNGKSFAWTDSNFNDLGMFTADVMAVQQSSDAQMVESVPKLYDKPDLKFTYQEMKARLWNSQARRYGPQKKSFIVIEPQTDGDPAYNPFIGLRDNQYLFSPSTMNLEQEMDRSFNKDKDFKLNLAPPLLGVLRYVPKDDNLGIVDRTFLSDPSDENKPLLQAFSLDAIKYKENMTARKEKARDQEAIAYAKTDFSIGEYAKIDDAKRITLAREFYKVAKNDKDVPALVKSSIGNEITSVADIGNTAISIGSKIPKSLFPGDYEREKIDAWRAVFAEIYLDKDKGLKKLQNFGVDLSDNKFMGTKVTGTTDLGEQYIKYWNEMDVSPDLLKQIVNRQVMSKMTGQTSTKFIQTEDDKIEGDSYTFGSKGQGKVESADQATPDSWNRLREVALDPQRIFPDRIDRHELINKLILFYQKGKNKYGGDLLPENLKTEKSTRLENLIEYFREFDDLVNTELKTGNSDAKKPTIPWQRNAKSYEYFEDSLKAISSDEGKTNWNKFSSAYQQYLNLETGRDTLNANQVEALIRASSSLKEEQQKKKDQNQEGAGNQFSGVQTFATGGMVYASKGTLVNYQPRGTDTVPAMLTPGEFVINREATQKHLPVLKAINEGYYSRGGIAKYLANGGIISPNYYANSTGPVASNNKMFDLSSYMGDLVGQITSAITIAFQNASSNMGGLTGTTQSNGVSSIDSDALNKIGEFTNRLKSVADTLAGLSAIPQEITITVTHTHNVIINGDAALNKLSPDLQEIAMSTIREKFAELAAANQIAGSPLIDPFQV